MLHIIEDDLALQEAIGMTLEVQGLAHRCWVDAESLLKHLATTHSPGLVVSDYRLPGMNGLSLLEELKQSHPGTAVVIMTAHADAPLAIKALKAGAADFLIKPFLPEQLVAVIQRNLPDLQKRAAIIAEDPATLATLQRCERVARADVTVLLSGESGVGKDVLARHIHQQSHRRQGPFVAVNCAAIPDSLLEATLFGHERGAFTGAQRSQIGKFEQAHGGSLFLDEIGEMPLPLQAKLLRVLQDNVDEPLGSTRTIPCDLRVIAATNQALLQRVQEGLFREDLYYRLAVFPIHVPPLRERPQDILPLALQFIEHHALSCGRLGASLSPQAQQSLLSHSWPGNVRELENTIQRTLLLSDGPLIDAQDIDWHAQPAHPRRSGTTLADASNHTEPPSCPEPPVAQDIESIEKAHILKVMHQVQGNRRQAVAILGLSERALRYKLKSYEAQRRAQSPTQPDEST